jgi:hypothetical protein
LLPKGMNDSTGFTEVLLDKAFPDRQRVFKDIIAATNLMAQVPARLAAHEKRVWSWTPDSGKSGSTGSKLPN